MFICVYKLLLGPKRQKEIIELFTRSEEPEPSDYAPKIVTMAIAEPDVSAEDIARCVKLGIPEPPKKKQRKSTLDFAEISRAITSQFAKLAILESNNKLTKELIQAYATSIYTWRGSINELITILEEDNGKTK